METEYCDKCGLLHDEDDGECLGCKMSAEIKKLKELLALAFLMIDSEIDPDLMDIEDVETLNHIKQQLGEL